MRWAGAAEVALRPGPVMLLSRALASGRWSGGRADAVWPGNDESLLHCVVGDPVTAGKSGARDPRAGRGGLSPSSALSSRADTIARPPAFRCSTSPVGQDAFQLV